MQQSIIAIVLAKLMHSYVNVQQFSVDQIANIPFKINKFTQSLPQTSEATSQQFSLFLVTHEQWHKAFLNVLLIIPVTFRCQKPIVTIVTPTKCIVTTIGCSHSPEIRTLVVVLCLLFSAKKHLQLHVSHE